MFHGPLSASTCYHQGIVTFIQHHAIHLTDERRAMIHGEGDDALIIEVCLLLYDGNISIALQKAAEMGVHINTPSVDASISLNLLPVNEKLPEAGQENPIPQSEDTKPIGQCVDEKPTDQTTVVDDTGNMERKPDQLSTPSLISTDNSSLVDMDTTYRPAKTVPSSVRGREGVFIRYHPIYRDYFDWLLDDGLDRSVIEDSMKSEQLDPSVRI